MTALSDVTTEQMARYRAAARRRSQRRQRKLGDRQEQAWGLARCAASMLKEELGVSRVIAFGSLVRGGFHERSDVDLAVWGLDGRAYYGAVSRLLDLDPTLPIDLLRAEEAAPQLLDSIEREGEPL